MDIPIAGLGTAQGYRFLKVFSFVKEFCGGWLRLIRPDAFLALPRFGCVPHHISTLIRQHGGREAIWAKVGDDRPHAKENTKFRDL